MPLPDLIEIVPLKNPVHAEITVPGSKSITNRALILAALAEGEVTLEGALWSEDTQIMTECLQELGFMVDVKPDPNEDGNRTITVYGKGGTIPPGGTEQQPMELFVGNAGTAARFLAAFVCLGKGVYRLHGVPRMHERPQAALFQALRELGYRVEAEQGNDRLPVRISHRVTESTERSASGSVSSEPLWQKRKCTVSIAQSSQFASALLLCAKQGGWNVEIVGENAEESPYVVMTSKLIEAFPHRGGVFRIEPDASGGSYFWGAGWLLPVKKDLLDKRQNPYLSRGEFARIIAAYERGQPLDIQQVLSVTVKRWPTSGWQIDQEFPGFLYAFPEQVTVDISRIRHLADSIMTAIVLAPLLERESSFTDLGRLRVQECERVVALRTELTKCGAKVIEEGDTLTVYPSQLHGAEVETYNDHRMAMCFAILGLKVPGIKLKNPACVKKTFPNFFQKLAAQPPNGLGAEIWEIKDGQRTRKLSGDDLFAE